MWCTSWLGFVPLDNSHVGMSSILDTFAYLKVFVAGFKFFFFERNARKHSLNRA